MISPPAPFPLRHPYAFFYFSPLFSNSYILPHVTFLPNVNLRSFFPGELFLVAIVACGSRFASREFVGDGDPEGDEDARARLAFVISVSARISSSRTFDGVSGFATELRTSVNFEVSIFGVVCGGKRGEVVWIYMRYAGARVRDL